MNNFKIIMLSLLFCPCSYQIIYPEDYKDLLDATYNLLLDQNNNHSSVIIQSVNQDDSGQEQLELATKENKIEESSVSNQTELIQEEIKTQLTAANMDQDTSTTAEESVEPAIQTTTVTNQPEAKMFKGATEQTATIEPVTSEEPSIQTRGIDPALTLMSLEGSPTAQPSTQLEDENEEEDDDNNEEEDDTTEQTATQAPVVKSIEPITTDIKETEAITTPVIQDNNLQTMTAQQQDLVADESSIEKSSSTAESIDTPQEKVSDKTPIILENLEQNSKETVTDTINTIPVEQVVAESNLEKISAPFIQENITENKQISQPEEAQIVKVYPVFDAARLGIQKIKSAAQSMLDYVYEFFTKKPEVKI